MPMAWISVWNLASGFSAFGVSSHAEQCLNPKWPLIIWSGSVHVEIQVSNNAENVTFLRVLMLKKTKQTVNLALLHFFKQCQTANSLNTVSKQSVGVLSWVLTRIDWWSNCIDAQPPASHLYSCFVGKVKRGVMRCIRTTLVYNLEETTRSQKARMDCMFIIPLSHGNRVPPLGPHLW